MLKKYIKQIQNINSMQFALGVILLIEIAYLIRFNFAHGADSLDCDAAKLMTHMAEIVKTGHFLIPGWRYMTTHEIDSGMLLAIPMYAITRDVFFSFAVSNSIFIIIITLVVLKIFSNCEMKIEYGLIICIIFLRKEENGCYW